MKQNMWAVRHRILRDSLLRVVAPVLMLVVVGTGFRPSDSIAQTDSKAQSGFSSVDTVTVVVSTPQGVSGPENLLYKVSGLSSDPDDVLNLRQEPVRGSSILARLPNNTGALPNLDEDEGWMRTQFCGIEGWVFAKYIEQQEPAGPQMQLCSEGPVSPYPPETTISEAELLALREIESDQISTDQLFLGDDSTQARDLGEDQLSTQFALCITSAGTDKQKQTRCIADETERWDQHMTIAFNLIAATLPFDQMRSLRDDQREWQKSLKTSCVTTANERAAPFSPFHRETCELKVTLTRAIELEERLRNRADREQEADTILDEFRSGGKRN